jgi:hypothetical protein
MLFRVLTKPFVSGDGMSTCKNSLEWAVPEGGPPLRRVGRERLSLKLLIINI